VKKPIQSQDVARVTCYALLAFVLNYLLEFARISCYKGTYFLLRFHVYLATQMRGNLRCLSRLAPPPVYACSTRRTLAQSQSIARLPASLTERKTHVPMSLPDGIKSPIIDGQFETMEEADHAEGAFSQMTQLCRIGRPEDMASTTLFLVPNDCS
jgi:hypothetical protein